jgi:hypothetical protein
MKKIAKRTAMIFIMIMLAGTVTGCGEFVVAVIQGTVEIAEAIGDTVEESRYKKAAETVIEYDDDDTF